MHHDGPICEMAVWLKRLGCRLCGHRELILDMNRSRWIFSTGGMAGTNAGHFVMRNAAFYAFWLRQEGLHPHAWNTDYDFERVFGMNGTLPPSTMDFE